VKNETVVSFSLASSVVSNYLFSLFFLFFFLEKLFFYSENSETKFRVFF
ncbi:hypothetical protein CAEBREN_31921, partial [Caenorhabditis brenneri]